MKELRRLVSQHPEVALGVAIFAGLALGAGWVPLPSLPSLSLPAPAAPATPATAAATTGAAAVAPAGTSWWD